MAELTADLKEAAINAQVRNIGMKIAVIKANQAFAEALGAMAVRNQKTLEEEIEKTENTKILAENIANEAEKMKGKIRAGNRYASVDEMINIIKQQMNLSDNQNILYSKLVEEAKKEAESLDAQDAERAARLAAEAEMTGSTIMRSNAVGTEFTGLTRESARTTGSTMPTRDHEEETGLIGGTRRGKKRTRRGKSAQEEVKKRKAKKRALIELHVINIKFKTNE